MFHKILDCLNIITLEKQSSNDDLVSTIRKITIADYVLTLLYLDYLQLKEEYVVLKDNIIQLIIEECKDNWIDLLLKIHKRDELWPLASEIIETYTYDIDSIQLREPTCEELTKLNKISLETSFLQLYMNKMNCRIADCEEKLKRKISYFEKKNSILIQNIFNILNNHDNYERVHKGNGSYERYFEGTYEIRDVLNLFK